MAKAKSKTSRLRKGRGMAVVGQDGKTVALVYVDRKRRVQVRTQAGAGTILHLPIEALPTGPPAKIPQKSLAKPNPSV